VGNGPNFPVNLERWIAKALAMASGQGRNNSGMWLACQLRDDHVDFAEAEAAMVNYASRTGDTNTKGQREAYTEREALATLRSAYGRASRNPARNPAREATRHNSGPRERSRREASASNHGLPLRESDGLERSPDDSEVPPAGNRASPRTQDLTGYPYTDTGNAERLIAMFGENLRWCEKWKIWLIWDGRRWAEDWTRLIYALAKTTVREMYRQVADIADDGYRKMFAVFARESEERKRIEAMISLARGERTVAVSPDIFDRHQWLLSCRNGTLDLTSGKLRPHRREDYVTKLIDLDYDPEATAPRWEKFWREVFEPHPDLIPLIQRAVGYTLTGSVREECLFLCIGDGSNGKGVFCKTVQKVLGDYAGTADFSTFLDRRDWGGPRDDVANMRGKRFIVSQESREGAYMAEGVIKWLTGGDRVRARRLHENSNEFDPTFKIWLATNHKPRIRGTDEGIWRRIKLIPFDVSFKGREDKNLKSELKKEQPGILTWAVRGCTSWLQEGLNFPKSILDATQAYRNESDQLGRFIEERCDLASDPQVKAHRQQVNMKIQASVLYALYRYWCEACGERSIMTNTAFGIELMKRPDTGITRKSENSGHFYYGINSKESLKTEPE
jgi:putative DNA primase/helicase